MTEIKRKEIEHATTSLNEDKKRANTGIKQRKEDKYQCNKAREKNIPACFFPSGKIS